jgi:hypothetical protein
MKPTVKAALIFAAIYVAFKIVLFQSNLQNDLDFKVAAIFLNTLLLLMATFLGLIWSKKSEKNMASVFVHDIKIALQGAMVYAMFVGVFTYVYYEYIDSNYMEDRIEQYMAAAESYKVDDIDRNLYPEEWTDAAIKADIIEKERDASTQITTPAKLSAITLMGLFALGAFYAFVITIIYRKLFARYQAAP